ncbi:hypothetical protein N7468_002961 [Penicillium chermesinum]|uniref:rRNA methyltransferase 1, mitochondrial n=1 Tax=Penicillium chermesinum TaxID=63820 RepID=A0A9W9TRE0_9EURO|nr:uncharacterized protein N7468_002961 [Penicillium chermesinum]KAJ5238342.1 hypothetical protein N7468_002961 [Penicillium chermesinum]
MDWGVSRLSLNAVSRLGRLASPSWTPSRYASLNSAIGRGIRRSAGRDSSWTSDAPDRSNRPRAFERRITPANRFTPRDRSRRDDTASIGAPFNEEEFIRTGNFRALPSEHQSSHAPRWSQQSDKQIPAPLNKSKTPHKGPRAHKVTHTMPERIREHTKIPDSVPYTTPASEFIYGTNAVEAALRCSRRQLYKLYLYQGANEELGAAKVTLRKLALSKGIPTKIAFAEWDRLLDKMSAGRPHNGCVIEASPLPKLPVRSLLEVPAVTEDSFRVELAPQTREEALVNGTNDQLSIIYPPDMRPGSQTRRYPVALLIDGVVDTGNLGAIIRSAYFLGIDAIIFAGRNSAPLSPVTIKASAGAAENMALLQVRNEVEFIQKSQENGWKFYAADAPGPGATYVDRALADGKDTMSTSPTAQAPSVIMMGSEASGLSGHIKSHADAFISIPGARHGLDMGVQSDPARIDSLNVSVAAALLMDMFMRTPLAMSKPAPRSKGKMW